MANRAGAETSSDKGRPPTWLWQSAPFCMARRNAISDCSSRRARSKAAALERSVGSRLRRVDDVVASAIRPPAESGAARRRWGKRRKSYRAVCPCHRRFPTRSGALSGTLKKKRPHVTPGPHYRTLRERKARMERGRVQHFHAQLHTSVLTPRPTAWAAPALPPP